MACVACEHFLSEYVRGLSFDKSTKTKAKQNQIELTAQK